MSASLALLFTLAAAAPQPKNAAAQLIDEGNELLDKKQYQAALARYKAAHEIYPTPKIFYNMGEASRELGELVQAADYYERFLAESGIPERSPLSKAARNAIAALEKRLGRITIEGPAFGAEVFVGGRPAGRVPLARIRVLPGVHQVVIQKDGFTSKREEVDVEAGEEARVDATLEPLAAPPPPPPPPPPVASAPPPPPITIVTAPPAEEESDSIVETWWFWTLIGGAVAIGVGAAVIATTTGHEPFELGGDLGVSSTGDWRRL